MRSLPETLFTNLDDRDLLLAVERAATDWDKAGRPDYLLWPHERLSPLYNLRERLNYNFDEIVYQFIHPESERLLDEFNLGYIPDHRLLNIIDRWANIGEQAIPSLLQALVESLNYSEEIISASIVDVLRQLGDKQAAPILIDLLLQEKLNQLDDDEEFIEDIGWSNVWLRINATKALGELGDVRAVPVLIQELKDDDISVRSNAAEALGKLKDVRAVPALIDALNDKDDYVSGRVVFALGNLRDARAVKPLVTLVQEKDLMTLYSPTSLIVATALNKIHSEAALKILQQIEQVSPERYQIWKIWDNNYHREQEV